MSKAKKALQVETQIKPLFAVEPWNCVHHDERSIIEAYVESKGDWQAIARIEQSAYVDAERVANYIVQVVNEYPRIKRLLREAASSLEQCLQCSGLTWSAEHDADIILRKIRES